MKILSQKVLRLGQSLLPMRFNLSSFTYFIIANKKAGFFLLFFHSFIPTLSWTPKPFQKIERKMCSVAGKIRNR